MVFPFNITGSEKGHFSPPINYIKITLQIYKEIYSILACSIPVCMWPESEGPIGSVYPLQYKHVISRDFDE